MASSHLSTPGSSCNDGPCRFALRDLTAGVFGALVSRFFERYYGGEILGFGVVLL